MHLEGAAGGLASVSGMRFPLHIPEMMFRTESHVFLGLFTQRSAGHYFCVFQGGPEREGDDGGAVANGISSCLLVSPSFLVSFNDPAARRQ